MDEQNMDTAEIIAKHPPQKPELGLLWTALVDVGDREPLGSAPDGERFIVPIIGGTFYGEHGLTGRVLAGGADRQLVTTYGLKKLEAIYEMETSEGIILSIKNRVTIDETDPSAPIRLSVIEVSAPKGPLEWMNKRIFLGTLQPAHPDRKAVIIRGWGQR